MSKILSAASGFQYSVNIAYDLNNSEKLKDFIPTSFALSLLENILLSTDKNSSDRARVLIGAYGRGKSHIVLMILSMLMKKDLTLFEKVMPEIRKNPRLLRLAENYYESGEKILPVIITGNSSSLQQSFLVALQKTLSVNNLPDIMPETNYHAALKTITRWQKEFPETYRRFREKIGMPPGKFAGMLGNYDASAYEAFRKIYPSLTSGSTFNPFLGFDATELYGSAAESLRAKGYTGIYVVYDEFSKYLEANIAGASVSDTKMLQDFAEKCTRSGRLQMHIMLISHKEISNYIDRLPKQKVDGWRGVSERFRHIHMDTDFSQTYEIIASVIRKKHPEWDKFCKHHKKDFESLYQRYQNHRIFRDMPNSLDTAVNGCYPLHPVSSFILPLLSEKVAQNERTLFTFLSAKGMSTLQSFLDEYDDKSFSLVFPDMIYDYFRPLLQKEAYSANIHTQYVLTENILKQIADGSLGSRIVKTISLIYMLEQYEKLKPTKEEITGIYSSLYTIPEIDSAVNELAGKNFVLYLKRSSG